MSCRIGMNMTGGGIFCMVRLFGILLVNLVRMYNEVEVIKCVVYALPTRCILKNKTCMMRSDVRACEHGQH